LLPHRPVEAERGDELVAAELVGADVVCDSIMSMMLPGTSRTMTKTISWRRTAPVPAPKAAVPGMPACPRPALSFIARESGPRLMCLQGQSYSGRCDLWRDTRGHAIAHQGVAFRATETARRGMRERGKAPAYFFVTL
jgi:hypothetical protein